MDPAGDPRARSRSALSRRPSPSGRERLARLLRPPRTLRPTRAGWIFFAFTLGVGFAAMNTGNNLMYMVLSLLLAFLVLSGVLSESALRGIRVRRRLPAEIHAETPTSVVLEIHNSQRRVPAFAIVVEDLTAGLTNAGRVFVLRLDPGERVSRAYRLRAAHRGELAFTSFRVVTRFPFGLFSKAMGIESAGSLLVYPRVDPQPVRTGDRPAADVGSGAGSRAGESPEAAGLREHAPGDAFRRVHWPASLRRGQLLVRDREREHSDETDVRLRVRGGVAGAAFESAVCRAASEVVAHLQAGFRVGLHTETEHIPAAAGRDQRRRLLTFLARVEPQEDSESEAAA